MTQRQQQQQRHVGQTIAEYGTSLEPVQVRLVGNSAQDVQLQIDRMVLCFGALFMASAPRAGKNRGEWIAYGTIVG